MWTAIVENIVSGAIKTPVFSGTLSGMAALDLAKDKYASSGYRVICVVQGKNDQAIYAATYSPVPL